MRTRNAMLLAAAGCGAGLFAGFFLFHPNHRDENAPAETGGIGHDPAFASPTGSASADAPVLGAPISRVEMASEPVRTPTTASESPTSEPPKPVAAVDHSDPRTLPENSTAEMKAKYDALNRYLIERTIPIFEQRWRDGLFKHLSDEGVWRGGQSDAERREIYTIRGGSDANGKDLGIDRDALPRWQYPDLYAYKDEVYRLEKLMEQRRIAEAEAAAPR